MRPPSTLAASFLATSVALAAASGCGDKLSLDPNDGWPTPVVPHVGAAGMVLVTNSGDDSVSWIDLTPTVLDQVFRMPVGLLPPEREGPHHGAVAKDGKSFFVGVSNYVPGSGSGPHGSHGLGTVDGSLLKYDVATAELIGDTRVSKSPGDVRLTPDGKRVVQTHFDLKKIQDVAATDNWTIEDTYAPLAIVDAETMVASFVDVCSAPHGVQVSSDSKTAYVSCWASDELAIVDLDARTVKRFRVGDAPQDPTNPTYEPYAVTYNSVDGSVWMSDQKSGDLRIFDLASETWDTTRGPVLMGGAPFFGQFSKDGTRFFVPVQTPDALAVVDVATGHIAATLPFAAADCKLPHAVLLTPDEKAALVVCEGDHVAPGTVALVDVSTPATPALTKVVTVGVFPDDAFYLKAAE
jgi:DNA-binding beta-propeller fold protein YncE